MLSIALDKVTDEKIVIEFRQVGKRNPAASVFYKQLNDW